MSKYNKLTRYRIKKIMEHFCVDLSATQTAFLLGLNRKTINRYYGKFRALIYAYQRTEFAPIRGAIEAGEDFSRPLAMQRDSATLKQAQEGPKQLFFGLCERDGLIYTGLVPDNDVQALQAIIKGESGGDDSMARDSGCAYEAFIDIGRDKLVRVSRGNSGSSKAPAGGINNIEAFWSFSKRRLAKFNGVSKNFSLHLKECEWRWNKSPEMLLKELAKMWSNQTM